nr:unnamed protein product [Digitaria exilis]
MGELGSKERRARGGDGGLQTYPGPLVESTHSLWSLLQVYPGLFAAWAHDMDMDVPFPSPRMAQSSRSGMVAWATSIRRSVARNV